MVPRDSHGPCPTDPTVTKGDYRDRAKHRLGNQVGTQEYRDGGGLMSPI